MKKLLLLLIVPFLTASTSLDTMEPALFGPRSYPEITGFWAFKPTIKVCKVASIPDSRVRKAISYWERLGYEFEETIYNDESMSCAMGPRFGEIVITLPDQTFDWNKLAITRTARNTLTGFIINSKIQLPPMNQAKERVLEHEIGHALGWGHTFRTQHIMNENWMRGGHDSTGMRHDRYIELSNDIMDNLQE